FFKGMQKYFTDPKIAYGFAHTSDFQRNMEAVSGLDLNYFFNQWFYGQGYPTFTVYWSQNANNNVQIYVKQTTSHPSVSFFKVPLEIVFQNGSQEKRITIDINQKMQQTAVNIGFQATKVLVDPDMQIISKGNTTVKLGANADTAPGFE
ncbi:MAG: hypothetical protein WAU24_07500, partial [Chitinophagaceae bacterium]